MSLSLCVCACACLGHCLQMRQCDAYFPDLLVLAWTLSCNGPATLHTTSPHFHIVLKAVEQEIQDKEVAAWKVLMAGFATAFTDLVLQELERREGQQRLLYCRRECRIREKLQSEMLEVPQVPNDLLECLRHMYIARVVVCRRRLNRRSLGLIVYPRPLAH